MGISGTLVGSDVKGLRVTLHCAVGWGGRVADIAPATAHLTVEKVQRVARLV
jgi:hypothetical protein